MLALIYQHHGSYWLLGSGIPIHQRNTLPGSWTFCSSCLHHRIFLLFGASERGRTQGGPWKSRESAHREGPTVHSQSTNDISTTWRTTLRLFVSAACTLPAFKGCMGTVCFKKHWSSGEVGLPVHYTYDFCQQATWFSHFLRRLAKALKLTIEPFRRRPAGAVLPIIWTIDATDCAFLLKREGYKAHWPSPLSFQLRLLCLMENGKWNDRGILKTAQWP